MLVVEIHRHEGDIAGFVARGHTGFASRGEDIVCAGASAVLQTAVLGIVEHLRIEAKVEDGPALLELRLPPRPPEDENGWWREAQAVLETAVRGLQEIARQHPRHVKVKEQGRWPG